VNPARSAKARGGLREVTLEATVIGPCRHCGGGAEFWPDSPCVAVGGHEAAYVRPLGVVARWAQAEGSSASVGGTGPNPKEE